MGLLPEQYLGMCGCANHQHPSWVTVLGTWVAVVAVLPDQYPLVIVWLPREVLEGESAVWVAGAAVLPPWVIVDSIQARDYYGPQDTASCLCIWHILHSEFLCQGWWALIFTECNPWVYWHTDSFCIGKSKYFDHPFNVAMLVDRYGPCASISLDFKS